MLIATVRTRNEERNIARFCKRYAWCDKILVLDSSDTPRTRQIAKKHGAKTKVYNKWVFGNNGLRRTPHGNQLNTLVKWAMDEGATWIINDDCDCFPNKNLIDSAKEIFEQAEKSGKDIIATRKIYKYGKDNYLKQMSEAGYGMWAWKATYPIRFQEKDPWVHEHQHIPLKNMCKLPEEYCLIHDFCPNEKVTSKKLEFYRMSGEQPTAQHPLLFGGELTPLERWMK